MAGAILLQALNRKMFGARNSSDSKNVGSIVAVRRNSPVIVAVRDGENRAVIGTHLRTLSNVGGKEC